MHSFLKFWDQNVSKFWIATNSNFVSKTTDQKHI